MRAMIAVIAAVISPAVFAQEQTDVESPAPRPPLVLARPADARSVADFVLTTCLSAVADPAAIDVMAREHGWVRAPSVPGRGVPVRQPRWRVDGFFVTMWTPGDGSGNPDVPACFVLIRPSRLVKRDAFFDAISAALDLRPYKDTTYSNLRQEMYEIVGTKRKLILSSINEDGTMFGASIFTDNSLP
jgi:hypothetical protein